MKIAIHYFSGCGNVAWVATHTKKQLEEGGHEVVLLQNAELAFPTQMPSSDVDIFMSPTYFFGMPANLISYFKRVPMVAGRKAIFWSVNGGMSGFSFVQAKNLLKDRGYEVIANGSIEMPDTFLFLKESQLTAEQRQETLKKALSQIADNLKVLDVLPVQKTGNIFKNIIGAIVAFLYLFWGRHLLGLSFVAGSKCTKCKKCVQNCPVHAIAFEKERPIWKTGCVGCFRCINNCPVQAIDFSKKVLLFYLVGAILGAIIFSKLFPFFKILGAFVGLLCGSFAGSFIFQKFSGKFADDNLCLADKKRVFLTEEEKHL